MKQASPIAVLVGLILSATVSHSVAAPTLTSLYSFGPLPGSTGYNPYAGLVQASNGFYYGTAYLGGSGGNGTVYRISPSGSYSNLHTFTGTFGAGDGSHPYGPLLLAADGNFYGTTIGGGTGGNGTLFRISPSGTFTNLYSFVSGQGFQPYGGLVQGNDGNLYGTTYGGAGFVFRISPNGGGFTNLYAFSGSNGFAPYGLVKGSDGNFYGTTEKGGTNGWNIGTVFRVSPTGSFAHLHSFSGPDGSTPVAGLVEGKDGNFYGTTRLGGTPSLTSVGTVFRISPAGDFTTLYSFNGCISNSCAPYGALMQASDGNFYGTTTGGGQATNNCNCGTLFRIASSGTFTLLYSFSGSDGSHPYGTLVEDSDSNLYGTTLEGGTNNSLGTVFKLSGAVLRSPKLQVQSGAGTITFQWPTNFPDFSIQANPTITGTNNWLDLTNVPIVGGTNYLLTLPTTNATRFFRLRSQ